MCRSLCVMHSRMQFSFMCVSLYFSAHFPFLFLFFKCLIHSSLYFFLISIMYRDTHFLSLAHIKIKKFPCVGGKFEKKRKKKTFKKLSKFWNASLPFWCLNNFILISIFLILYFTFFDTQFWVFFLYLNSSLYFPLKISFGFKNFKLVHEENC